MDATDANWAFVQKNQLNLWKLMFCRLGPAIVSSSFVQQIRWRYERLGWLPPASYLLQAG